MRVISWNVNGVRSAIRHGLLDWLERERPDVLCLQETRVDPATLPESARRPSGYESSWAAGERPGYAGVATCARAPVAAWREGLGVERFDREGRVLRADLGGLALYNVYFPNGKSGPERLAYKLDFCAAFLAHIDAEAAAGQSVVFCGDVNTAHRPIDLARPAANERVSGFLPIERAWLDRWREHGWVDSFRHLHPDARGAYTWWSPFARARERNVGWRLDYCFIHERLLPRLRGAGMYADASGSDHCPVWLDLDL
mgnify:CR=1 FL=1